jgi:uncharacterized protein YcaQ
MARAPLSPQNLRAFAIAHSMFQPTSLQAAIDRMGFVQADPIRSPARAQDLILRHRVRGYRAGDLERRYASLDVEEDYLYAYGFLSRRVWNLLHPRKTPRLRTLEGKVLDIVRTIGQAHPRVLEARLGRRRTVNAWGGYSTATTDALAWLHYRGLLRIARRERGVRIYEATVARDEFPPSQDRLRRVVLITAGIFAPSPEKSLLALMGRYRSMGHARTVLRDLIRTGELEKETVDGIDYVWPAGPLRSGDVASMVRFLAPFDPVVWDRVRFEHLWGWSYRFEAYTPAAKRIRGYYALPLLWRDSIVGWANASVTGGRLKVDMGFVDTRPRDRAFTRELEAEIARLELFLISSSPRDP